MEYTLMKNSMYKKEGDPLFVGRARVNGRVTKEQVITRLSHASSLTEGDINSVLTGLEKILIDYIVLGHSIDLGFLTIGYSIKGGFDSENDSFRKDRNWVNINSTITSSFECSQTHAGKLKKYSFLYRILSRKITNPVFYIPI